MTKTLTHHSEETMKEFDDIFVNKKDILTRTGKKVKNRLLRKGLRELDIKSFILQREKILHDTMIAEMREWVREQRVDEDFNSSWHKENAHGYNEALTDFQEYLSAKE